MCRALNHSVCANVIIHQSPGRPSVYLGLCLFSANFVRISVLIESRVRESVRFWAPANRTGVRWHSRDYKIIGIYRNWFPDWFADCTAAEGIFCGTGTHQNCQFGKCNQFNFSISLWFFNPFLPFICPQYASEQRQREDLGWYTWVRWRVVCVWALLLLPRGSEGRVSRFYLFCTVLHIDIICYWPNHMPRTKPSANDSWK